MDYKISKNNIIAITLASLIIFIFHNINIDWYIKDVIVPYSAMIISYLYIFRNKINRHGYLFGIPIVLILVSHFIIDIDISNMLINIILLPILIFTFFFTMLNKNFYLSINWLKFIFRIFPNKLFSNLKLLKKENGKKSEKTNQIIFGLFLGGIIGYILLSLLLSADAYFDAFIGSIFRGIYSCIDFNNIILLISSFIILFSVYINIFDNVNTKLDKENKLELMPVTVTTILVIINSIYGLFIISELSKLTTNFLRLPIEYTYARYAREGFFQLLFVTLINYFINIFLLYKSNITKNNKVIKKLCTLLSSFSIMLIFNSYYRMYLYISHYGFTVLRLQVILFLFMELILFILLMIRMYKSLKNKDIYIYYIIIISIYIINLFICNDTFIKIFNL